MWPYILAEAATLFSPTNGNLCLLLWPHRLFFLFAVYFKNIAMSPEKQINQRNMFDLGLDRQSNRLMKCLVKKRTR